MRNERTVLVYIIVVLTAILSISGFGYMNYRNTSFNGLSRKTNYTAGKKIKYANLNWFVVKDDGKYVTLMLTNNAKVGNYGDTNLWKDSDVKAYLNDEWIKYSEQITLKEEIEHGALVLDTESRSYVRLVKIEELNDNPIKNESNTPYWTMSSFNDKVWYALENGYTEYTTYDSETSTKGACYKGTKVNSLKELTKHEETLTLQSKNTINEPYEMNGIASIEYTPKSDECYKEYKVENGLFSEAGEKTSYTIGWNLKEQTEAIGIRPVITVKKK